MVVPDKKVAPQIPACAFLYGTDGEKHVHGFMLPSGLPRPETLAWRVLNIRFLKLWLKSESLDLSHYPNLKQNPNFYIQHIEKQTRISLLILIYSLLVSPLLTKKYRIWIYETWETPTHFSFLYGTKSYSKQYIQYIEKDILWIINESSHYAWLSYDDIYQTYVDKWSNKTTLNHKKRRLLVIERFDLESKNAQWLKNMLTNHPHTTLYLPSSKDFYWYIS